MSEDVRKCLQDAADTYLKDILGYETQPLVSTDYINDRRSSVVDALSTQVHHRRLSAHQIPQMAILPPST